ncbi:MAG: translation initiation factor IF-2 N-terminal domain-containing protein, partial [Alphaproteobacteria bacterium]|nr:translation initiation factor IF-2 N-terminal domain-containing protein [Alphaproteobacteria bacterium]
MSDTDGKKPLGLRGGPGSVKQSFSHGRTKSVVVETKRKRVVVPKAGSAKPSASGAGKAHYGDPSKRPAGISDAEMERRMKALAAAKSAEVQDAKNRAEEEKAREEERERRRREIEEKAREEAEREAALKAKEEEEARAKKEAEDAKKREVQAKKPAAVAAPKVDDDPAAAQVALQKQMDRGGRPVTPAPRAREREETDRNNRNKVADNRRSGKLTVNQALTGGEGNRHRSMASMKRKQERMRQKAMGNEQREKVVRDVRVPEAIVVSELANRMAERVADVVKSLMNMGMMVTQNQSIDADTAELIVEEFGHRILRVSDADVEDVIQQVEEKPEDLKPRPPVVTIMGHV